MYMLGQVDGYGVAHRQSVEADDHVDPIESNVVTEPAAEERSRENDVKVIPMSPSLSNDEVVIHVF